MSVVNYNSEKLFCETKSITIPSLKNWEPEKGKTLLVHARKNSWQTAKHCKQHQMLLLTLAVGMPAAPHFSLDFKFLSKTKPEISPWTEFWKSQVHELCQTQRQCLIKRATLRWSPLWSAHSSENSTGWGHVHQPQFFMGMLEEA